MSNVLAGMHDRLKNNAVLQNESAFRSIFLTFGPKVTAMLIRQGAHRDTAEDIVQDTMLTVWRKSHLFAAEKGAISTWIYTIARNLRIDRLRRQVVWEEYCGQLLPLQDSGTRPKGSLALEEQRVEVEKALICLSTEQFEVVRMTLDGYSQAEIADRLGVPVGTVKSRLRLAFGKLRYPKEEDA